jgi:hypothetical protein
MCIPDREKGERLEGGVDAALCAVDQDSQGRRKEVVSTVGVCGWNPRQTGAIDENAGNVDGNEGESS